MFPLNSGAFATGKRKRAPCSARLRGRWFARRVVDVWTNLTVEWLNFEASGRQVNHTRPQSTRRTASSEHPASASAVANVRRAVKSMCRDASGLPLVELGLGRGKIKNGWDSVDQLQAYADKLAADGQRQYRTPAALGSDLPTKDCGAEAIDVQRLALPKTGAVLDVADLLESSGLREAYERPDSLLLKDEARKSFVGRRCDRLPATQRDDFARALDSADMLHISGADNGLAGGVFAVRKKWDQQKEHWIQRLVLDRRPRNAEEELVGAAELHESMPHGTVWCELQLDPDERMALWATDLQSFYYACRVSPARAESNQFTKLVDLRPFSDLCAVRAYRMRLAAGEAGHVDRGALCLNALAMGDINATGFAQAAHRELLRRAQALPEEMPYRAHAPNGRVCGGVMIDDFVVAARVPLSTHGACPGNRAAEHASELFTRAREAYKAAGVPDVDEKRRECVDDAVVWGCEIRGREGRVGSALLKRAGLAALSISIAASGVGTGSLLSTVLGLWVDVLLYRRPAFALLDALPRFVQGREEERVPRVLPGPVVTELWGLAAIAPLLDTNIRAPVGHQLFACDASLEGGGACAAPIPVAAAKELWRVRMRAGPDSVAGGRGLCFAGELAESLPWTVVSADKWRYRERRGINLCEGRARRMLIRAHATEVGNHGSRVLVLYDSTVTAAGAARGRSAAPGLRGEQRRAYPALLAADIQEGALWCDSERNPADAPSRANGLRVHLEVPAPSREWVSAFLGGDNTALNCRITALQQLAKCIDDPLLREVPDFSASESWQSVRQNDRISRVHERAHRRAGREADQLRAVARRADKTPYSVPPSDTFDKTKGYEGEGPQRGAASRARSAPNRVVIDFERLVLSQPQTVARRNRFITAFDTWLVEHDEPQRCVIEHDPPRFDRLLACYGQHLWDSGAPQSHLPEVLNAVRKLHPALAGRLKGAWDVRTAWQHLEPGENRAPVPEKLARALVAVALSWEWCELGALIMVTFEGALRPGDVLGLTRADLRFADEHGGVDRDLYVVLRHAKTAAMRGARWQHVRIRSQGVIRLVRHVFGQRSPDTNLFTCLGGYPQRARALAARFQAGLCYLEAPYGRVNGFVFSGLRAGGITSLFERTEDLALTRWRGRWDSTRSMEHYVQELPASAAFAQLSVDTRRRIFRLSDALPIAIRRVLQQH